MLHALAQFAGRQRLHRLLHGRLGLLGAGSSDQKHELLERAEGNSETLSLATWVALRSRGRVAAPRKCIDWRIVLYAMLSLTVVRMLPIYLSLTGLGMRADAKLFVGWFGPRGLASIVFLVMVANENLPGNDTMVATVVATVVLSIIAHESSTNRLDRGPGGPPSRAAAVASLTSTSFCDGVCNGVSQR